MHTAEFGVAFPAAVERLHKWGGAASKRGSDFGY